MACSECNEDMLFKCKNTAQVCITLCCRRRRLAPSNRQLGYIQFISWSPCIAWYLSVAYFPVVNCNYSTVQKPWTARFLCTVWALRRYVLRFKWPSCCQTSLLWYYSQWLCILNTNHKPWFPFHINSFHSFPFKDERSLTNITFL